MAEIIGRPSRYTVELTSKEYGLVGRALAFAAGRPIKFSYDEQNMMWELNKRLLHLRYVQLKSEQKIVLDAIAKVAEFEQEELQVESPEPGTTSVKE